MRKYAERIRRLHVDCLRIYDGIKEHTQVLNTMFFQKDYITFRWRYFKVIPYLVVFIISIYLLYLTEEKKFATKKQRDGCVVIAIVIPCVLAALRADTIGTDVLVYVKPLFENATNADSFFSFINGRIVSGRTSWKITAVKEYELGYLLLTYILAKIPGVFSVFLFVVQLFINTFIYKGLKMLKDKQSVWMGMAVFYLMIFHRSLNLVRQCMAISLLVFAFHFLEQKQYKKYVLLVLVSSLFHKSALVGFVILVIYYYLTKGKVQIKQSRLILISVISVLMIFCLNPLCDVLSFVGLGRYVGYIQGTISVVPRQIILRTPILILYFYCRKELSKKDRLTDFYFVMLLLDLLASQLASVNSVSGRIGLLFSVYNTFVYSAMWKCQHNKTNDIIVKTILLLYLVVFWYYQYVFMRYNATVPYISIL